MALIRKFLDGGALGTPQQPVQPVQPSGPYKINDLPARKFFSIGDDMYDLKTFENLVWHNFDAWIDHNKYDNTVRTLTKLFINLVLQLLGNNEAKFNSDYSLDVIDKNNEWDLRPGFNKRGPAIFHLVSDDKIDDNRGIPHIAMNYLLTIIRSPYMKKKPENMVLSGLTRKVLNNVARLNFDNSLRKFDSDDNGFLTYDQKSRANMFKEALIDFRRSTDFSIYDNSTLENVDKNMLAAIDLLGTTTKYDKDFFDKMSNLGFHNLRAWLRGEGDDNLDNNGSGTDQGGTGGTGGTGDNSTPGETGGTGGNNSNSGLKSKGINSDIFYEMLKGNTRRWYSKSEYDLFAKDVIFLSLNEYYSKSNDLYATDWRTLHKIGFRRLEIPAELITTSSVYYNAALRDANIENDSVRPEIGLALTRQLLLYVYGLNAPKFNENLSKLELLDNIKLVMSRINSDKSFYNSLFTPDIMIVEDSYDPYTKAYLAVDKKNHALFAMPEIFVDALIWTDITNKINNAIRQSGVRKQIEYDVNEVIRLSLKEFLEHGGVTTGNLGNFFGPIKSYVPKRFKQGGILKCGTGAELMQGYTNNNNNYVVGEDDYLAEIDRVKAEAEQYRQYKNRERESKNAAKSAYNDIKDIEDKYEYLARLDAEISSLDDLKKNLDVHDYFVIHTLLSDIVAFGGSLSGGAFNPVTDAATLSSIVGTIGTVATDKSLNTLEKIGYGALGVGLNVIGLVPELGAGANAFKISKVAKNALPVITKLVRYGALGITGLNALKPLNKLASGEKLTKGDWTNLAYFVEAVLMGNIGRRATRDYKRYTKYSDEKTTYHINTKGGPVLVSASVYNKLKGNSIKKIKAGLGKDEVLKDLNGKEIIISSLRTNYHGKVLGSYNTTAAGVRLKTLEELHNEYGIPKMTVRGKTVYEVPAGYLSVARKLGQTPIESESIANSKILGNKVVVDENAPTTKGGLDKAKGSGEQAGGQQGGQQGGLQGGQGGGDKPKPNPKPTPKPLDNPKPKPQDSPDATKKPDAAKKPEAKPQNKVQERVLGDKRKLIEARREEIKKKLESADEDVKKVVKEFIQRKYKGNNNINYNTNSILHLFERVNLLKKVVGPLKFPKSIREGDVFFVGPKGGVLRVNKNTRLNTYKLLASRPNQLKFAFKTGGSIPMFADGALTPVKTGTATSQRPRKTTGLKVGSFFNKLFNDPNLPFGLAAVNLYNNNKRKRELLSQELGAYKPYKNNLIYKNTNPYGVLNQAQQAIGANNSLLRPFTSNINKDMAMKYETNVVAADSALEKAYTAYDNKVTTALDALINELKELNTYNLATAFENDRARKAEYDKLLTYDIEKLVGDTGIKADFLEHWYNENVSKKEASEAFMVKLTEYALKKYGPYVDAIKKITKQMEDYYNKHKEEEGWLQSDLYQSLYKEYLRLLDDSKIYNLRVIFDASLGEISFEELLDRLGINLEAPFIIDPGSTYDSDQAVPNTFNDSNTGNTGLISDFLDDPNAIKKDEEEDVDNTSIFFGSRGGSLSYEDRINLKRLDALNDKLKMYYRMILEDHKLRSAEKKQRDKSLSETLRLISKKAEMLLKASLQLK